LPVEISQHLGVTPRLFGGGSTERKSPARQSKPSAPGYSCMSGASPGAPSTAIVGDDQDQIARHREHAIDLSDMITRVEGARRWPSHAVDGRSATLPGQFRPMEVSF
jgi:hypothetical protein